MRDAAARFDPDATAVVTATRQRSTTTRWSSPPACSWTSTRCPGWPPPLAPRRCRSNYRADLAPRTWELIRNLRSGTAVFTQPAGPIKCAGAPQKIAYLAADYWRKQGVLGDIRVVLVLPDPVMFKVPVWAAQLEKVAARYGIEVRRSSELVSVDGDARTRQILDNAAGTEGDARLRPAPRGSAAERPRRRQEQPAGRPGKPVRLRRGRPVHAPAQALPERVRPRRRGQPAHLEDRRCDPQAGAGGRREPARSAQRPAEPRTSTTVTPPAHSSQHATRCCSPSSTTTSSRRPRSR